MDYRDYIKDDSDGNTAYINRKGLDITKSFIAKNGGASKVSEDSGIARSALNSLKNHGYCSPSTWKKFFEYIHPETKTEDGQEG